MRRPHFAAFELDLHKTRKGISGLKGLENELLSFSDVTERVCEKLMTLYLVFSSVPIAKENILLKIFHFNLLLVTKKNNFMNISGIMLPLIEPRNAIRVENVKNFEKKATMFLSQEKNEIF